MAARKEAYQLKRLKEKEEAEKKDALARIQAMERKLIELERERKEADANRVKAAKAKVSEAQRIAADEKRNLESKKKHKERIW